MKKSTFLLPLFSLSIFCSEETTPKENIEEIKAQKKLNKIIYSCCSVVVVGAGLFLLITKKFYHQTFPDKRKREVEKI